MAYWPIDVLDKVTRNRYEAVIVAAQHARHLNAKRLAAIAQILEGDVEDVDLDTRKITAVALKDLMDGEVQFERHEDQIEPYEEEEEMI